MPADTAPLTFETEVAGIALSRGTTASISGGLAPFFATWLTVRTGDNIALMVIGRRTRAVPRLVPSSA